MDGSKCGSNNFEFEDKSSLCVRVRELTRPFYFCHLDITVGAPPVGLMVVYHCWPAHYHPSQIPPLYCVPISAPPPPLVVVLITRSHTPMTTSPLLCQGGTGDHWPLRRRRRWWGASRLAFIYFIPDSDTEKKMA